MRTLTRMEITINSRPDADGRIWFMVQDGAGDHHAPRLGRYLEVSARADVKMDCGIFLGVKVVTDASTTSGLTGILREISRYYTGHPLNCTFSKAEDLAVNGSPSAEAYAVGPVLYFVILPQVRTARD